MFCVAFEVETLEFLLVPVSVFFFSPLWASSELLLSGSFLRFNKRRAFLEWCSLSLFNIVSCQFSVRHIFRFLEDFQARFALRFARIVQLQKLWVEEIGTFWTFNVGLCCSFFRPREILLAIVLGGSRARL